MLAQVTHHFEEPVGHEVIFTDRPLDSTAPPKSIFPSFGFFFFTSRILKLSMVNCRRRLPLCLLQHSRVIFTLLPRQNPHADSLGSSGSLGQLCGITCPKFVLNVCECSEPNESG